MIIQISVHYHGYESVSKPVTMDVTVDRADIPLWWRRPRPWASLTVRTPFPQSSTEGLKIAISELAERLQLGDLGLDYADELDMSGFGDVGTVTHLDQVYDDPQCTEEETEKRYAA